MKHRNTFLLIAGLTLFFFSCQKENAHQSTHFYYPSAFTPDGDCLNDSFGPIGGSNNELNASGNISPWPHINYDTFEMHIRNKNGRRLFFGEDINERWDGTFKGDTCPRGFYYYTVKYETFDGTKYRDKGVVELLRN